LKKITCKQKFIRPVDFIYFNQEGLKFKIQGGTQFYFIYLKYANNFAQQHNVKLAQGRELNR
jgi:hypothetical protein